MEKEKKKGGWKTWLYRILMLVCLAVLLYSGYKLFEIWQGSHQITQETEQLKQYIKPASSSDDSSEEQADTVQYFSVDWAGLKAENPNVVAWLIVPGTQISYPVVQGSDNSYYLNHTYTGQVNKIGSAFMDAAANPNFQDDNTLIYGHSVDVGGMFTNLKYFADLDFFNSHPYFWILTPEQNYKCMINAFYQGNDQSALYTTSFGDFKEEVMNQIYQESLYTRSVDSEGKHFVTLSTCNLNYGFNSDQRYVLMGVMEPYNDPIPVSEEN